MKRRDFVKASFGAGVLTLTVRLGGGKSSETALPQQLSRTSLTYPIVDTGQTRFYDNFREIPHRNPESHSTVKMLTSQETNLATRTTAMGRLQIW